MAVDFSTRTARFWFDEEDGILCAEGFEGAEQTLADVEEGIRQLVATGRRYKLMIDISKIRSMTRESRALYGSARGAEAYAAIAIVVGSPLSRAIGNFFVGLNRLPIPTRLFTTREEARTWLRARTPGQ